MVAVIGLVGRQRQPERSDCRVEVVAETQGSNDPPFRVLTVTYFGPNLPKDLLRSYPAGIDDGPVMAPLRGGTSEAGPTPYPHFWGEKIGTGQPSLELDETEWGKASVIDLMECPKVAGPYQFRSESIGAAKLRMTSEQEYLDHPKVEPIEADPFRGFIVRWKPVKGAVGYRVEVRGNDKHYSTWKNSERDWHRMGWREACRTGVLITGNQCTVPGGVFHQFVDVDVKAVSPDVRGEGTIPAFGWAESSFTIEVGKSPK